MSDIEQFWKDPYQYILTLKHRIEKLEKKLETIREISA